MVSARVRFCNWFGETVRSGLYVKNKTTEKCIFVLLSPLHVSMVKPPLSGGTKGHKHRFASNSHVILRLRIFQCPSL
jgi:hypothetical protein